MVLFPYFTPPFFLLLPTSQRAEVGIVSLVNQRRKWGLERWGGLIKVSQPGSERVAFPTQASWAPKCQELLQMELTQISIPCNLINAVVDLAPSSERLGMHTHHSVHQAQALHVPWEAQVHSSPLTLCALQCSSMAGERTKLLSSPGPLVFLILIYVLRTYWVKCPFTSHVLFTWYN